jgi:hypothetical protein
MVWLVPQPSFNTETEAREYLEQLLIPWFEIEPEVSIRHITAGNLLRIDYVLRARKDSEFPFDGIFGVECKANNEAGSFNRTIKQAIDYTQCIIVDSRFDTQQLQRIYIFPAPTNSQEMNYIDGWHGGAERIAGLFNVGLIHIERSGQPKFCMSADCQWSVTRGPVIYRAHDRTKIGSGVARRKSIKAIPVDLLYPTEEPAQ